MADVLGYAASIAVLATFLMRTMVPLRLVAILSNILFLAFGYIQNIHPVFFLHLVLLPVNVWRLFALQHVRARHLRLFSRYLVHTSRRGPTLFR
jgi:CRP/FNR family transcriptional regulator, cyclic AMP receptor protein